MDVVLIIYITVAYCDVFKMQASYFVSSLRADEIKLFFVSSIQELQALS